MNFEKALTGIKKQNARIIREKNSGNEYFLTIDDKGNVLVMSFTIDKKNNLVNMHIEELISWKEIFSNNWELIK